VVSIPACHAGDPGSIPGLGVNFFDLRSNGHLDKTTQHTQHEQATAQNAYMHTTQQCPEHALPTPLKKREKVLPGLEPGLQGSKPWVLTNYTIEPACCQG
jgi:hypothetical protein